MSYQSADTLYDDIVDDTQRSLLHSHTHTNNGSYGHSRSCHEAEQFQPFDAPAQSRSWRSRRAMLAMMAMALVLVLVVVLRASSQPSTAVPPTVSSAQFTSLSQRRGDNHHHSHNDVGSNSDIDSDYGEESKRSGHHSPSHSPRHSRGHSGSRDRDDDSHSDRERQSPRRSGHDHDYSYSASAAPDVGSIAPSPLVGNNPAEQTQEQQSKSNSGNSDSRIGDGTSPLTSVNCEPPYPGYPFCESKVNELQQSWAKDPAMKARYISEGVDGSKCSFLTYLNKNGFYCPEAGDYNRMKIRGVNLGGWLVLEPWIKPSLFTQFAVNDNVRDQWSFCAKLGKSECKSQLEKHWDTWLTFADLQALYDGGINHVRIPVGYWLFGDIAEGEPWVTGDLYYLERALKWCKQIGLHVVLDLHCAPGSQNGFDNSGKMGEVHFADTVVAANGRITYPNINRALKFIDTLTEHFSSDEYKGIVVGIELVNEAFISIPLEIVKDYYLQGYDRVKKYGDIAVVIGDSFRFGAWGDFMFPPHYRHVWIDTHIYQVFDTYRLSFTGRQHIEQTCKINKPEVAVAPLSTVVGEWSLATVDCARWLNGYNNGARYDGTFRLGNESPAALGSCQGQNDITDTSVWTPEYKAFLRQFAEAQMDAYESGSSAGWFFWNFKTESAPQWDYLLGLKEGWMPSDHSKRKTCEQILAQ